MSKRTAVARHRAESTSAFQSMTQAVSANAGTVGRQAAVVAAASGLVLTLGLPAQADQVTAAREVSSIPASGLEIERASFTPVRVTAAKDATVTVQRQAVDSRPAPEPEPVVVPEPVQVQQAETATQDERTEQTQAPQTQTERSTAQGQQARTGQAQADRAERAARAEQAERTERAQADRAERAARAEQAERTERAEARAAQAAEEKAAEKKAQQQAAPVGTGNMGAVVSAAYSGIGTPYVYGGKTRAGWDCSGFTSWAYAQAGISIPSSTRALLGSSKFQRTSSPKPGDLVFQRGGGHVGIYVGNGQMIGAQNPSNGTFQHSVNRNPLYGYYTYVG